MAEGSEENSVKTMENPAKRKSRDQKTTAEAADQLMKSRSAGAGLCVCSDRPQPPVAGTPGRGTHFLHTLPVPVRQG